MGVELLDMRAIAKLTKRSDQTVRWWRSSGQLPPEDFMLGQSPGWLRTTIEDWLRRWDTGR